MIRYVDDQAPRFAVAPMMDWTDRHCRFFHRLLTRRSLLYTEMVVADALIHGAVARHLAHDEFEHPLALQLGGSEPEKLAEAVRIAADWGFAEINLNVGCPSDRVQSGIFGACLMREPELVARCVAAMKAVSDVPVTVKCRIGVDDQDNQKALDDLARQVFEAGCDALWVHARKAWLQGLSPKENRDIPPLDHDRVYRLKADYPGRFIGINGGITTLEEAQEHLKKTDGVMFGRAAYQNPTILRDVDQKLYGDTTPGLSDAEIVDAMADYIARQLHGGLARPHAVTRHMIGLFHGRSGARRFRQILSVEAVRADADESVLHCAFAAVEGTAQAA